MGGATWVSLHHGGGVGIGYSIHAGQVIVADGTEAAARRLERVLTTDPGMGVIRHGDAGYPEAMAFADQHDIQIPMRKDLGVSVVNKFDGNSPDASELSGKSVTLDGKALTIEQVVRVAHGVAGMLGHSLATLRPAMLT
ncbi:MAG: hypothetical protein A2029_10545 [Chloroflexi bacterium RBG_19FT_COMBO_47_9]|nr:MAG: hypothetical protein A2Y53_06295 [Chloroflexi bacterium RBG_16_47_49]OGO60743.1 MAG: hypothetical protein A2029_10545 [Chloroflexi bacterium RBG_19FT_COMBO_47_9]